VIARPVTQATAGCLPARGYRRGKKRKKKVGAGREKERRDFVRDKVNKKEEKK
jgi:hypothetical protein